MITTQRVKFLKLFAVLLLMALLFQLYIERASGMDFWHSLYSALCYGFPVALVATLALILFDRTRNGD